MCVCEAYCEFCEAYCEVCVPFWYAIQAKLFTSGTVQEYRNVLFTQNLWVIPPGWGKICDGVNCYIHKCTICYPWLWLLINTFVISYWRWRDWFHLNVKNCECALIIKDNIHVDGTFMDVTIDTVTNRAPTWWNDSYLYTTTTPGLHIMKQDSFNSSCNTCTCIHGKYESEILFFYNGRVICTEAFKVLFIFFKYFKTTFFCLVWLCNCHYILCKNTLLVLKHETTYHFSATNFVCNRMLFFPFFFPFFSWEWPVQNVIGHIHVTWCMQTVDSGFNNHSEFAMFYILNENLTVIQPIACTFL